MPRVLRINQQVPDLNILVATGIYTYADVPGFFSARGPGGMEGLPEVMTPLFVRDLTQGVQGTDVKAAFLKCAIDHHGLTKGVERIMRACAQAALETGAPLMVHTHPRSQTGLEVQRVLAEEGLAPDRVQLAHSGDSTDADHLSALADEGFLLGMDRFGIDLDPRPGGAARDRRGDVPARLRRAHGAVAGRRLLHRLGAARPHGVPAELDLPARAARRRPGAARAGVTQEQVDDDARGNPRRFFER